jgi:hypothetical protein
VLALQAASQLLAEIYPKPILELFSTYFKKLPGVVWTFFLSGWFDVISQGYERPPQRGRSMGEGLNIAPQN